ncbi:MAG: 5-methylcytosine-specific restriction system specificity protein McrC [Mycobacterium sp.]|nr:5-methylcytosine-specific restriction system specificity protein McrC [Mycobacterium sp.]
MLYASKLYASSDAIRGAGAEQRPDELPDLVAEILAHAVEHRLKRNLSQDYIRRHEPLTRVRGRIDILQTETRQLLSQGRVSCRYTELAVDNPRNRLILAGLATGGSLARNAQLAHRCRQLAGLMRQLGVRATQIAGSESAGIALGRNDVADADAVNAARLLLAMDIPNEETGSRHRLAAGRDAEELRRIYEAAVGGLLRVALPAPWRVRGGAQHRWPVGEHSAGAMALLPIMRTDVIVETTERRIIIETKFADALTSSQFGDPKLSPKHVFQLFGYVQSQDGRDHVSASAEGVLLYPVVGQHIDEFAVIGSHRYRFLTVDLSGSAQSIREQILAVVR